MTLPRITIVTPSFNQGEFLEETICSVLDQGYRNLEYMVIDGGSTDDSAKIIARYSKYLAYHTSEKDNGQAAAINKGLRRMTGDFFNWINSDDLLEPGALDCIAELSKQHPDAKLLIGATRFFGGDNGLRKSGRIVFDDAETTIGFGHMNQPGMFYRSDALRAMGELREELYACMDLDWWIRYLLLFGTANIAQTEQTVAAFRLHDAAKTSSAPERFEKEKVLLYRSLFESYGYPDMDDLLPPVAKAIRYEFNKNFDVERCFDHYCLWNADYLSLNNQRKKAGRFLKEVRFLRLNAAMKKRYLAVQLRLKGIKKAPR